MATVITENDNKALDLLLEKVYRDSRHDFREYKRGTVIRRLEKGLTATVLEGYFTPRDQSYVVRTDIRRMLHFSYFDLTSTNSPPFAELDCVFCCNVLIYLRKALQERILDMLYHSLATPGYLVLGEVETPTESLREKVECLDIKARIYRRMIGPIRSIALLEEDKGGYHET